MTDKTAEQLRACRDAFECEMHDQLTSWSPDWMAKWRDGDYVIADVQCAWLGWQAAWRVNTRADSGEAVAFVWFATDDNGHCSIGADADTAVNQLGRAVSRVFPLFTHPRHVG